MAYNQRMKLPDGQELVVYSEGNANSGVIRMDGPSLTMTGGNANVNISNGANLIFQGSTATIGGTSTILSLGQSGDTVALNVPGVTYNLGTVTGDSTFLNNVTVSGTLTPAALSGTIDVTNTTLSWARDTDYATMSYVDYGADNDQLTIDFGDRQTDFVRFRGANASGTLENVLDIANASITAYKTFNAPTIQEGGTNLASKYLGISAKAVDSDKLDNLDSTQFLRSDTSGTMSANLTMGGTITMGTNSIIGSAAGNYLSLNASPTLSSVSSVTIWADSDNSSTTEYLSLKAGSDELKIVSDGTITFNANKVWHAGNDGTGSGLDADTLDGIDSTGFGKNFSIANSTDLNTSTASGFYRINDTPVNGPAGANWSQMLVIHAAGDTITQIVGGYSSPNLYFRSGNPTNVGGTGTYQPWAKIWNDQNDGSGSGLDADTVDGVQASSLMRTDANTSTTGTVTIGTGTTSVLANQTDGSLRVSNSNGYIDIAPKNVSYAHIYTDRPSFYFNVDLLVNGNKVWHAGNDGTTSGLDADMVDGIHLSGLVQTSRNVSTGTGLSGGGNLSADRTLTFDTVWGDARYLAIGAKAADSEKLDNLDSTQFMRSDADDTMTGILTISTNSAESLKINRTSATANVTVNYSNTAATIYAGARINSLTDMYFAVGESADLSTAKFTVKTSTGEASINGNKVWHAGNDGLGSGLDADLLDGLDASQFLRSDAGNTITGGNDLRLKAAAASTDSGDLVFQQGDGTESARIYAAPGQLSLSSGTNTGAQLILTDTLITYNGNTVWHAGNDGAGSGLDADLLDGLNSSSFVRTDADSTVAANLIINTNSDVRNLIISRNGSATGEAARHGVTDGAYNIFYQNDETSGAMKWTIYNDDTETGTGTNANTSVLLFTGSVTPSLTLNNNKIWHEGNDGTGSGLDADLLDGVQLSGIVQTSRNITGGAGITIDAVTGAATNLTADRTIAFDTTWGDNRYLGKTAKAADSDKLDNLDSTQFVRNDSATTMAVGLLFNATATAGPTSATPTALSYGKLQSYGTFTIAADTDGSGTENLNLAAGYAAPVAADGLSIGNTTLKWKSNDVWHAGNDGAGSTLDADLVDGIHGANMLYGENNTGVNSVTDLNAIWRSGSYNVSDGTNTPGSGWWWVLNAGHVSNSATYKYQGQLAFKNLSTGSPEAYIRSTSGNGTITSTSWGRIWHDQNDGVGSGLDADKLDGLQGSDYLRSNTSSTFTGNLTLTGNETVSGTWDVAGLPTLSGWSGSYREGQKSNFISRMNGRILNRNPDFINNTMTGYSNYDNGSSNRIVRSIVSDDTIPNGTGKLMRISYDHARSTTATNPGYGGFTLGISRTTGNPTTWGYKAGNRYVFRVVANIPSGKSINFASNSTGTGGGGKWLTSQSGTGNWQEYAYMYTIGNTGTFADTGYFNITGGTPVGAWTTWAVSAAYALNANVIPTTPNGFYYTATTAGTSAATQPTWPTTDLATITDGTVTWTAHKEAFTWDVSICQVIGIDEVPDVDRAPNLNVGYKSGVDVGWGEIYSTGKITTDSTIAATGSITGAGVTSTNSLTVSSGDLTVSTGVIKALASNAAVELGSTTVANTPFIDFHSSGGAEDYTSRIIASGGTSGTAGSGTLTLTAASTIVSGGLTVNKVSNVSTITFPAGSGGNDAGYIKHDESTVNAAKMYFSVSDDALDSDYFSFGATPSGTYTEAARITAAGNATFKGLTINGGATVTGNITMNGVLTLDAGTGDGLNIGGATIRGVASGELLIGADELRLGRVAAAWDYSKWVGFKYDDTLNNFTIGGPASANLKDSTTPVPRININFEGTTQSSFDGKVIIQDAAASTIGKSTMANGWLQLGTTTSGMSFDINEIFTSGNTFYIGTIDGSAITFAPNQTDAMTITSAGKVGIGNVAPGAQLDVSGDVRIASNSSLWVGNVTSGARARFHHNGTNAYIDFESGTAGTGDLYFRSGTTSRFVMFANGNLAVNQSTASAQLDVNGTIKSNNTITGLNFTASAGSFTATGANNGFIFPSGKKIYSNGTDNWIRTDSDFYTAGFTIWTTGNLQAGANSEFQVNTTTLNWRSGTIYSNTAGKVSINRTSNPATGHNLDVKSSGNNMGINIQANADTDVSGITFQNTGGNFTWHIARSAVAAADLNFYGGNNATVTGIRTTPSVIFYNAGGAYFDGDITNKGNVMIRGNSGLTQTASITLALGDGDTGFKWNSDGNFDIYANNTQVVNVVPTLFDIKKATRVAGNVSLTAIQGYGYRFWDSDSYKIYMSSSTDATWGRTMPWIPTDAANADYFIYSRIEGGNRGWAFRNDNKGGVNAAITGDGQFHTNKGIRAKNFSMEYNTTEDSLDFVYQG